MDNTSINDIFPEELVEKVLRKLPPASLKAALLVCRTWKRLGEQPKLWWWINLKVTIRNLAVMPQVLAMDRLKTMTELRLFALSEELMNSIVSHPELKMLNFHFSCSLSSAEPALLATVINKMEEVDFGGPLRKAYLTPQQCQAIFNFFGINSKLRKLTGLTWTNLSSVDPQALARAVTMLEEVEMDGSDLNDQQLQTIFQFLNGESKLKVLYIGDNDLHSVQPEVLARAITKLEEVNLIDAELTAQQCQLIFLLLSCESKLKKLCIAGNDLSSVPPKTLAKAIVKLEKVILTATELTPEQCQSIFKLASYNSKLRTLWIGFGLDLTSVDPAAVAKVVIKLEEVSLSNATLTAEQYQTMIKSASSESSQLKKVFMDSNDLSSVGPEDLAKAVSKLKEVGLSSVKLTAVQCQAIFKLASRDYSKLNKVHIAYTDLSSADSDNLAKAVTKLEEVRLTDTKLTMFKILSCETKLKILDVRGNDLSSVDRETMSKVISKMEDVCLSRTKLTHQQCETIFNLSTCESKLKNIGLCDNDLSCVDPEVLGKVVNKMDSTDHSAMRENLQICSRRYNADKTLYAWK